MLARPPAAEPGIVVDVVGPVGLGFHEHRAEHAVGARQRAHRRDQLVAHARHQEAAEAPLAVGDPKRGVSRAGELAGGVDELLQHLVHRQVRGDGEDRVADRLERRVEALRHSYGR